MATRIARIILLIVTWFIALTAIGGGIAILTGVDEFPPEWLARTPFPDYTIPALLLAVGVGGSALAAGIAQFRHHPWARALTIAAGAILMGYVAIEILVLEQTPPGPTTTELVYLALGIVTVVLAMLSLPRNAGMD